MADTTAPTLISLDIPEVIDLSTGDAAFEISAVAEDDLIGLKYLAVWLDEDLALSYTPGESHLRGPR